MLSSLSIFTPSKVFLRECLSKFLYAALCFVHAAKLSASFATSLPESDSFETNDRSWSRYFLTSFSMEIFVTAFAIRIIQCGRTSGGGGTLLTVCGHRTGNFCRSFRARSKLETVIFL